MYLTYGDDGTPLDMQRCFSNTPAAEIKTIAFYNRYLPYWIQISYDSNVTGQRSLDENVSIGHAFRGSVVVLAYDPEKGLSAPALDVDTTTLGALMRYARLRAEYEGPVFVEQPQVRYEKEMWESFMGDTGK